MRSGPAPMNMPTNSEGVFYDPNAALNKWSFAISPDGTYKQPKDFMEEFAQHMHQNVYQSLQGKSKEEIKKMDKCECLP